MGSALLLIFDVVIGMHPAMVLTTGTLGWFVTWWFILPVWTRIRHQGCDRRGDTNGDLPEPPPTPPARSAPEAAGRKCQERVTGQSLRVRRSAMGSTRFPRYPARPPAER